MNFKFITKPLRQLQTFVRRNFRHVAKIVELSKWFNRKSQHYILGNWLIYIKDKKVKRAYYKRYLRAYLRFLYLCRDDIKNT